MTSKKDTVKKVAAPKKTKSKEVKYHPLVNDILEYGSPNLGYMAVKLHPQQIWIGTPGAKKGDMRFVRNDVVLTLPDFAVKDYFKKI